MTEQMSQNEIDDMIHAIGTYDLASQTFNVPVLKCTPCDEYTKRVLINKTGNIVEFIIINQDGSYTGYKAKILEGLSVICLGQREDFICGQKWHTKD